MPAHLRTVQRITAANVKRLKICLCKSAQGLIHAGLQAAWPNIARAVYDHSLQLHCSCGVKYIIRQAKVDEFMRFPTLFLCASLNLFVRF